MKCALVPYLASTLLLTTIARPTLAEAPPPSSEARAMAETLFFTGRGLMEAKRYTEACVKFAESYRLDAAAGTLLNLAVCHEKVGKIASAWGEFKQALAEAKKAGREDRQQLATEHIDAIEPELPYITIRVPGNARVAGLEVARNGSVLTQGGWDAELPVDPGKVEIISRAAGYKPKTKTVTIEKKQHLEVTVEELEKAPLPVIVTTEPGWSGQRKFGFALMGVGVVGLGVGGYFGYRTLREKADSDKACPVFDEERRCSSLGAEKMEVARRDAWISNVGLGVGLGTLAVGTYLFIRGGNTAPADAEHKSVASSIRWSLGPTRDGVAGVLVGAF
jgi:hypothetical protein